jgi:hypothetical protein
MSSRTKARTARGWDIGLAAAILAVVLLGWLTAPGTGGAAPHSGQVMSPARLSGRATPGVVRPRGSPGRGTAPATSTPRPGRAAGTGTPPPRAGATRPALPHQ